MNPQTATALLNHLGSRHAAMVELLVALATAESPSHDAGSQRAVQTLLADALRSLGMTVRITPGKQSGGYLLATSPDWDQASPCQMILGHSDTVWPLGTVDQMPVTVADGRLFGPGVYDMKGGLVQAIFALEALQATGHTLPVAPIVLVNSDEEIGSPESTEIIQQWAARCERVFVVEPSLGPGGALKTTRKGVGRFSLDIVGRAAHAGLDPEKGLSAILEASHVIQKLSALDDVKRGITVNVGVVQGGSRPNVIAQACRLEIDVRVATAEDAQRIERAIRRLPPTLPGARLEVSGGFNRPPLETSPGNRRLWELAHTGARSLGIELQHAMAGGGSDGNLTGPLAPTLDGLGAVGDGAHASGEHIQLDALAPRAALLATLLLAPPLQPASGTPLRFPPR